MRAGEVGGGRAAGFRVGALWCWRGRHAKTHRRTAGAGRRAAPAVSALRKSAGRVWGACVKRMGGGGLPRGRGALGFWREKRANAPPRR